MALHEITIMDRQCSIGKFSAIEGWKIIHKLSKSISPLLGSFKSGDIAKGFSDFFSDLTAEELIALIRQLTSVCLVDGVKVSEKDLSQYAFTLQLCGEVVKHNFGDFFSQIMEAIVATGQQLKAEG